MQGHKETHGHHHNKHHEHQHEQKHHQQEQQESPSFTENFEGFHQEHYNPFAHPLHFLHGHVVAIVAAVAGFIAMTKFHVLGHIVHFFKEHHILGHIAHFLKNHPLAHIAKFVHHHHPIRAVIHFLKEHFSMDGVQSLFEMIPSEFHESFSLEVSTGPQF